MTLEIRGITWSVDKEFEDAITTLVIAAVGVNAAVGDNVAGRWYRGSHVYQAAWDVAEAYQAGQAVYKDDSWVVDKNFDDAITALVYHVIRTNVPRGPYSGQVYEAARNIAEARQIGRLKPFYFYDLTYIEDYEAELDRRRQIGLTIDPSIAETKIWWADSNDPYRILDAEYHGGDERRPEYFARNPGAGDDEWVYFHHLPIATRKALWQIDKRLTDVDEYNAEVEWRKHVGLSIDTETAETACWCADMDDRYGILDPEHQRGTIVYRYFARNPGGTWVEFGHLPDETRGDLLWKSFNDTVERRTA